MHNHQYCGCNHDLHYCSICDVCYCSKCGKEWGRYYPYYTYSYGIGGTVTLTCNHHDITNIT